MATPPAPATELPPRLAIVGTGAAAVLHGDAARAAGIPVAAVVGRRRRAGHDLAAALGARAVALEDLPGLVDVVLVATDPPTHATVAGRVLDLGLPVLVERPLAGSAADATRLAARGARAAENLRYAPLVRAVLARGLPPVDVEVRVQRPRPGWGFWPGTDPRVGLLVDLAASAAAVALDALGADDADVATALLAASEPAPGMVHVDLRLRSARARLSAGWTDAPLVDVQVAGDGFVSRAELLPTPELEFDGSPVEHPSAEPLHALGYVEQLRSVLPALAGASPALDAQPERGVALVRLLTATLVSLRSGVPVAVADVDPATALLHVRR
jgi:predicted dehydrogenase